MQERDYIDSNLYLIGEKLYDKENAIELGQPRYGKMLRYLYDHSDTDLSCWELYRHSIGERSRESDYVERVREIARSLWKKHEKLKEYIRPTKKGYIFLPPLRLKPDGDRVLLPYYVKREQEQEELLKRAFAGQNCFLIYGPPGMGKTELAGMFAREYTQVLRLYRNVFTVRYEKNLEHTITTIRTEGHTKTSPRYEEFLEKLEEEARRGKILLIVDNMDITPEVFAGDQQVFEDLRRLEKVHVLFTSRNALDAWFDGIRMELKSMEPDRLYYLFCRIASGQCTESKDRVTRLIREALLDNTYLTVLCGKLLHRLGSFDILENALLKEGADTLRENISVQKDNQTRSGTLIDHIKPLYVLSNLNGMQKALLSALCLVPTGGMERRTFLDRAAGNGGKWAEAEQALAGLEDSFWVIRSGTEVKLHPMVREIVRKELVAGRPFRSYVEATARALYSREYENKLLPQLHLADAAWTVIEKQKTEIPETAFLAAQIASTWDTLRDYQASFAWSERALPLLDKVERRTRDAEGLHWLALCYNVTGFALTHTKTEEAASLAKKALQTAEALVEQGLQHPSLTGKTEEDLLVLRTKIRSNLAARCLSVGDYEEAARRHEAVLAEREILWQSYGKEKYRELVAASHKNIGTAQFYLAKQVLTDSWKNHGRATDIYAEEDIQSESYVVAFHRSMGSLLRLLDMSEEKAIRDLCFCTREELLLQLLRRQREVLGYMMAELPLAGEIRNGYDNACRILYHALQKGICTGELMDVADQIWSLQYRLPEDLNPELREKIRTTIYPALLLLDKLR